MKNPFDETGKPLYIKLYNYYYDMIINKKLKPGTKMPSIRSCSEQLGLSRTTVEAAYMALVDDGYIISQAKSGYYVTELAIKKTIRKQQLQKTKSINHIKYNFLSARADIETFNFDLWRRYIKSALRQDDRLISYGEPQGEPELREALAGYIEKKRNVICTADNIVVGAGIQSILHILCPLINESCKINFITESFKQGEAIFRDHGWSICDEPADIIYTTPSHIDNFGKVMGTDERIDLINQASSKRRMIIEDDYDSEFAYTDRKTSSIQGLAAGENVVYAATFSRLLLPSIRMSFMVLPETLMKKYSAISDQYNQTASKTEQIALSQFIRDGNLDLQIRKQKKIYNMKLTQLTASVQNALGNNVIICETDSDIHIRIVFKNGISPSELMSNAEANGIRIKAVADNDNCTSVILSCISVRGDDIDEAVNLIKKSAGI